MNDLALWHAVRHQRLAASFWKNAQTLRLHGTYRVWMLEKAAEHYAKARKIMEAGA